ncbi:hypothetical protein EYZ11_009121 [Aspergillus tanneri]|uniref:Uncharacterized protein n=1 Tax=Aspergillus tanneri TaxID=1220188 RepID=A0A4S3JE57_9EURO|nr:uncharacterized protein ATNIH1004_002649 [Aspergillus tanneri]KAA8649969.1 hypothetical protein ATNIH1004_002649 [Aspergillus tanneri]THC91411.1 hypothetical protein EYZ11_009121 [Aspergillus tanneri]
MAEYKFANSSQEVPRNSLGNLPTLFPIQTDPDTDVWSKPSLEEAFNAPILYRTMPLKSFKRARVAFSANWKHTYDQGGLILVLNKTDGTRKWVKTGIEYTHGRPHLSTVAKDRWADWSLQGVPSGGGAATLELVKEDSNLWIYLVEGIQRVPLREVTWVFEDLDVEDLWVGVYAAKPSKEGGRLEVNFGHLVIDTSD